MIAKCCKEAVSNLSWKDEELENHTRYALHFLRVGCTCVGLSMTENFIPSGD